MSGKPTINEVLREATSGPRIEQIPDEGYYPFVTEFEEFELVQKAFSLKGTNVDLDEVEDELQQEGLSPEEQLEITRLSQAYYAGAYQAMELLEHGGPTGKSYSISELRSILIDLLGLNDESSSFELSDE